MSTLEGRGHILFPFEFLGPRLVHTRFSIMACECIEYNIGFVIILKNWVDMEVK